MPRKVSPAAVPVGAHQVRPATPATAAEPDKALRRGPSTAKLKSQCSVIGSSRLKTEPETQKPTGMLCRLLQGIKRHIPSGYLEWSHLVVTLGCILWTLWLVLLTVHPNNTVNKVMHTKHLDNGAFWLMIEPSWTLKITGVFGFALVIVGYLFILVKLTLWRRPPRSARVKSRRLESVQKKLASLKSNVRHSISDIVSDPRTSSLTKRIATFSLEAASGETRTRKFVNVGIKLGDFVLQLVLLSQSLENGYPLVLIYTLSGIIALNAVVCVAMMCLPKFQSGLVQVLLNCGFDFLIAVGFPMIVVTFCLTTFHFDRKKFAINEAVFTAARYERIARVMVDPVTYENVLNSLNSLRIQSVESFLTRVGTNLSLCFQLVTLATRKNFLKQKNSGLYPYRHPVTLLFVLLPVAVAVYVSQSIGTSEAACLPHPECIVHAFRWISLREGDKTQCPCLTLVDENVTPKTFTEWLQPENRTEKFAQLASSGDLRTIQITNRLLPTLPDELRRCKNLKHLALMYTHTEILPSWTKELTKLEFMQIEAGLNIPSLVSLPDDLFDDMDSLSFLQIAVHQHLRRLPSFRGLVNLRSLSLSLLLELEEVPPFTSFAKLERLTMVLPLMVETFPDMSPIKNLLDFVLSSAKRVCCNGFLDNKCDFTRKTCVTDPAWKDPTPTCLPVNRTDKIITEATRNLFAKFNVSVCNVPPSMTLKVNQYPAEADVKACNGTLYRQCQLAGNRTGMCYSLRMMPIACTSNAPPVAMRKQQIAESVGDKCDPQYEAWLGCPSL